MIARDVATFRSADERGVGALTAADLAAALRARRLDVPDDLEVRS